MRRIASAGLLVLSAVGIYRLRIRRMLLTWGATQKEIDTPMLGDDLVQRPHFVATRAVTIAAPPSEVWKWIVQIGSQRAGWYSYDWIDKCMLGIKERAEAAQQERHDASVALA